ELGGSSDLRLKLGGLGLHRAGIVAGDRDNTPDALGNTGLLDHHQLLDLTSSLDVGTTAELNRHAVPLLVLGVRHKVLHGHAHGHHPHGVGVRLAKHSTQPVDL